MLMTDCFFSLVFHDFTVHNLYLFIKNSLSFPTLFLGKTMYKQENEMLPYLPLIQVCFPAQLMLSYSLVHRSDYDQYLQM